MKGSKRVLVYDSQFLTRQGITTLIESLPEFEVVGETSEKNGLIPMINKYVPDVVIVGIVEKDESVIHQISELEAAPNTSFLIITGVLKKLIVQRLLNTGVKGVLTKTCSEEEIINGLRAVTANNRFYCNTILDIVMNKNEDIPDCDPTSLSEREFEVLELIANGHKTAKIAELLFLSVHTVNSHRKSILKKLNVKSPTELVVYALETGLVSPKTELTV